MTLRESGGDTRGVGSERERDGNDVIQFACRKFSKMASTSKEMVR